MADNINMTADEFLDKWFVWAPRGLSAKEADLLTGVLINILTEFEERGSPTENRELLDWGGGESRSLFASPDIRVRRADG